MNTETLEAVLWDMDGTIIDSEPQWLHAELAMLEKYEIPMTQQIHDRLVGSGLWNAAEFFRQLGVDMTADEIVAEWVASVAEQMKHDAPQWRPGARELLESLRQRSIPCALVTMSVRSLADEVIALLPAGTFRAVVTGDEVEHEKPHPQPYLLGAAALGVPIERCIALEDSPAGLGSASSAGAVAIGIPNLLPLDATPAHHLLPTLDGVDADALQALFSRMRGASNESGAEAVVNP